MFDYAGTRAERQTVERNENGHAVQTREVLECPDCGSDGVYDANGDIVCSDDACGLVIDDSPAVIPQDYSGSRGFENEETQGRYSMLEESERTTRGSTELSK